MNKWENLLHYSIIRQAFMDENGVLRLKSPDKTIRGLLAENVFLRHIFGFPKYMDQHEILALLGQDTEEYQKFAESLKPLHFIGKIQQRGKNSAIVLLQTGEEVSVKLTNKSLLETGLGEDETVHIFCDKEKCRIIVKAVVSDALYEMTGLYCGDFERLSALEEYLQLAPHYQHTIKQVMCDREAARSILLFLSFAVSRAADGCNLSSDEALETAIGEFQKLYADKLISVDMIQDIVELMDIQDLFLPSSRYHHWASDSFSRFLVVYAIANGISPWHYGSKTTAQILADKIPSLYIQTISEYLPHLCDHDIYRTIMDEVLTRSKKQAYMLSNNEDLLFEALTVSSFENSFVERACDILFKDSIAENQVTDMDRLLSGPNGNYARDHILNKCFEEAKHSEAAYHFAAAAILNSESLNKGTDPLEDAVESVVLNFDKYDLLLGITRVGLTIWTQLGKRKQLFNEGVVSSVFRESLLQNLRCYDKLLYSTTASTVHDLVLAGWFPCELLNEEEIFRTAVATLQQEDGKLWAARLLAIMPWDESRVVPDEVVALCPEYLEKMEKALCKEDEEYDPEVYFGLLVNLGFFRNRTLDKISAFQKIVQFFKTDADQTQLRRLSIIQGRLNEEGPLQGIPQQANPLSSQMKSYFEDGMK